MRTEPIQVMVVEDEVLIGLMLAKKLRSYGFSVGKVITTGEEAIERAALDRPEVILMDVSLAGALDGIEAAGRIKSDFNIPIVIFTGYDDKKLHQKLEQLGPAAIVAKMGPLSDIITALENAVA